MMFHVSWAFHCKLFQTPCSLACDALAALTALTALAVESLLSSGAAGNSDALDIGKQKKNKNVFNKQLQLAKAIFTVIIAMSLLRYQRLRTLGFALANFGLSLLPRAFLITKSHCGMWHLYKNEGTNNRFT